jgi:cytochrome c oxidase cbb3-type subunit II
MSKTILLALGILLTITASVTGLVIIPNWQFQELKPVVKATGLQYPERLFGDAHQGRAIYINQGCIYCHSQQVREKGYGGDIKRGWGTRRSVPRDYIYDRPHQLGTMRTGPDLASIGARQSSSDWHALHLYDPQITSPGSVMPRFNYFFTEISGDAAIRPPANAVKIPSGYQGGAKYILPNERGVQLIAYLKKLNQSFPLPEAQQ